MQVLSFAPAVPISAPTSPNWSIGARKCTSNSPGTSPCSVSFPSWKLSATGNRESLRDFPENPQNVQKRGSGGKPIKIFDSTLRDGCASLGHDLSRVQQLKIARELCRAGIDIIEVGTPSSGQRKYDAVAEIASDVGTSTNAPVICALARGSQREIERCFKALQSAAQPRIHTYLGTSTVHTSSGNPNMGRNRVLEKTSRVVSYSKQFCDDVQFSAFDATRTDPEFLCKVFSRAVEAGATTLSVPDSVGCASPHEIGDLIRFVMMNVPGIEKLTVSVHAHNKRGLAVANSLAAIENGATQVECTLGGIGEPCGMASLHQIVAALHESEHLAHSIDMDLKNGTGPATPVSLKDAWKLTAMLQDYFKAERGSGIA